MPARHHGAVRTGEHRLDRIKSAAESHEQLPPEPANKATLGEHSRAGLFKVLSGRPSLPRALLTALSLSLVRFCAPEPGGAAGTGHGTEAALLSGVEAALLMALDAGRTAVGVGGAVVVGEGADSAMLADLAGPPHPASVAIAQTAVAAAALRAPSSRGASP